MDITKVDEKIFVGFEGNVDDVVEIQTECSQ
jgi:hypothetical protein